MHCICKISVIHKREPGKYCGPGILCQALDIDNVKNPPAKNGAWVDGLNTFVEQRQGYNHLNNYENIFPDEGSGSDQPSDTNQPNANQPNGNQPNADSPSKDEPIADSPNNDTGMIYG